MKPDPALDKMLGDLCDGVLSEDGLSKLGERLRFDPLARQRYREYVDLHATLLCGSATSFQDPIQSLKRERRRTAVRRAGLWVAVVGAGLAAALLIVPQQNRPVPAPTLSAMIEVVAVEGDVELATRISVKPGDRLAPGDALVTGSEDSFVAFRLESGAKFEVGADARLRFFEPVGTDEAGIELEVGFLRGALPPGPSQRRVFIRTPSASVQAGGTDSPNGTTQFQISADEARTAVETESGVVHVVRTTDGAAVDVRVDFALLVTHQIEDLIPRALTAMVTKPRSETRIGAGYGLAFVRDGPLVAFDQKGWAEIDARSGRRVGELHALDVPLHGGMLSSDGSSFVYHGKDNRLRLASRSGGASISLKQYKRIEKKSQAVSANGSVVATLHAGYDLPPQIQFRKADGTELPPLFIHVVPQCVSLSPDGRRVAAAFRKSEKSDRIPEHRVIVWDVATRAEVSRLVAPDRPVRLLEFSPDGQRIAGACEGGAVHVWGVDSKRMLSSYVHRDWSTPTALAFSPGEGRLLASGSTANRVFVWDTSTDREVAQIMSGTRSVVSMALSGDGATLATWHSEILKLWDLQTAD